MSINRLSSWKWKRIFLTGSPEQDDELVIGNKFMVTHSGQTIVDKNIVDMTLLLQKLLTMMFLAMKRRITVGKQSSWSSPTSNDGVTRCPAFEEEYCDPLSPTEEWIQCCALRQ
ncbi:hypothetical protein TNCV_421391 [Trichonephila clavipes]|nr:hypothetical protein TNCV_421391 [Trichonephila clavipes]